MPKGVNPAKGPGNGNAAVPITRENATEMALRAVEARREARRLAWERAKSPEWFDPTDDRPMDKRAVKAAFSDLTGLAALKLREALLSDKLYPKDLAHLATLVFDRGLGAVTQKVAVQAGFSEDEQAELRTLTEDQLRQALAAKAEQEGITIEHEPDSGTDSAGASAPRMREVVPCDVRSDRSGEG